MLDSAAMTRKELSANPSRGASMPMRAAAVGLMLAALYVGYFSHLGALGFVGPDEPRYAWVAREMAETGDWVTPRLYGKPWFEKPILYYWLAAAAFRSFRVSEATARLPSAMSALIATLALAWFARRIYGEEAGRRLALLLPATVAMMAFSRSAGPDMPFAAMLTLTMIAAASVLGFTNAGGTNTKEVWVSATEALSSKAPVLSLVAFGFFLGAASLAKGPAAIILTGGATSIWALATKRWRCALRLIHPTAIATFCVTAIPWYVLCALRNPEFLRIFILEHNFARFFTPMFQHIQPVWFFVPIILLGALPWTMVLLSGMRILRRVRTENLSQSVLWFVGCWALFPILFFSLSKSKLPGYVLPSFPPLIFLCSQIILFKKIDEGRRASSLIICQAGIFVALGIAAIILPGHIARLTGSVLRGTRLEFIAGCILGGTVIALVGLWRGVAASSVMSAALMLALIVMLGRGLAQLDAIYFSRDAANFASDVYPGLLKENAFVYRVRRAQQYSLNFYLHRELPEWQPRPKCPALVFTPLKEQPALEGLGLACSRRHNLTSTSLIVCTIR